MYCVLLSHSNSHCVEKNVNKHPVNFTQEQVTIIVQNIHEVVQNRTELLSEYH